MISRCRARPLLWILLALVAGWGALSAWQRARRETLVLATTSCPFSGAPVIRPTVHGRTGTPTSI